MKGSYFIAFYKEPTLSMQDLQILHGQLAGFHFHFSFSSIKKIYLSNHRQNHFPNFRPKICHILITMVNTVNRWDDKFRCITQVIMRFFSKLKYFIHYLRRHPIGYFIHLIDQSLNTSIVYRDSVIFLLKLIQRRRFVVIYYTQTAFIKPTYFVI